MKKRILALLLGVAMLFALCACGEGGGKDDGQFTAAIMLPGVKSENPTFGMYCDGIQKAMTESGSTAELKIIEGGASTINYARYLKELADSEEYDVIFTCTNTVTSNLRDIAAQYPDQKFAIVKGDMVGTKNDAVPANVFAVELDSFEEGFLGGYYCAMVTASKMERANEALDMGVVFPSVTSTWQDQALPAFKYGAETAMKDMGVEGFDYNKNVHCVLINSWTDTNKGQEIARTMFNTMNCDIIWYSTGVSCTGAVLEANDQKKYAAASTYDAVDYATYGETILGCNITEGVQATYLMTKSIIDGTAAYGKQENWGADKKIMSFNFENETYKKYVPEEIQTAMLAVYDKLASKEINAREYILSHKEYVVVLDE